MLDILSGRVDGSQVQLGEGRTHPWEGWLGEGKLRVACGASGLAERSRGLMGFRPPTGQTTCNPKHGLQKAAYQHGCS